MSAHFPRITKHDLEVVVEAMDKLREAIATAVPEVLEEQREMQRVAQWFLAHWKDIDQAGILTAIWWTARNLNVNWHVPLCRCARKCSVLRARFAGHRFVASQAAAPPSVDGLEAQCSAYCLVNSIVRLDRQCLECVTYSPPSSAP